MTTTSYEAAGRARLDELLALRDRAYRLAARVLGPGADAEDAVQEAFLEALRRLSGGARPERLRGWFLAAVLNAARELLRSEKRRRRREAAVQAREAAQTAPPADGELVGALSACLAALDEKYRLPIALCYEEGLSQREAAEVLGLPEGTVFTNVNRGLERLREALARAGYAAAPAAILGGLAHTAPPVPSSLAAALEKLAAGEALNKGTASAAASAAAKGGLAMKIVVGVILASALAGGTALLASGGKGVPGGGLAAPPGKAEPVAGAPRKEHYALAMGKDYLDGPRLEAMSMGRLLSLDAEGNGFILNGEALGSIRVIRAEDGLVETVSGDNKWNTDFDLAEGPAAFLPELTTAARAMAQGFTFLNVSGAPLKGEEHGCLYAGVQGLPFKVYRNKEKGGRWWFKRMGTAGGAQLPTAVGKTAAIKDCNLAGAEIADNFIIWKGNYYSFDAAKGEAACLLSTADYASKVVHPNPKFNFKGGLGLPEQIVRSDNGSFYLRYYNLAYPEGIIVRVPPDRDKVEVVAWSHHGPINFDGPGLDAGYFGGPYIAGVIGDCVLLRIIDGNCVRRLKDGRTSKLFLKDGEWRETKGVGEAGLAFKNWIPGPDNRSVYTPQPGEESGGDIRIYKISPIDFLKPTAGPKLEEKKP